MNFIKIRNTALTLIGLAALAAYVLACRPAFSPDGSKVVFPVFNESTKQTSVALYDLNTRKTESILVLPRDEDSLMVHSIQWTADGKQVIANGPSWVMVLPLGSRNPTRFFVLNDSKSKDEYLFLPPPVVGRHMFLGGESLARLDLETGEIFKQDIKGVLFLTGHGGQVYYLRDAKGVEPDLYEVGRVDAKDLTLSPILKLTKKENVEISPFLSLSKDAARLAVVVMKKETSETSSLLIYRGGILEKTLPVTLGTNSITLGNTEWSPDGKTIYAAYEKKAGGQDNAWHGIVEIPLSGNQIREIPLYQGAAEQLAFFQIALAPNGKTIAASTAFLDSKMHNRNPEDHTLFLVDVRSPARKITRIPVPLPPTPKPGDQ